ncbi:AbrB/MazE/SpoVT family DNA-binding domain-containing protein [Bacillus sp. 03113]|uniref:AbrB/MazE/SpoVT family DNA-binding domain-containing protein n=1 Tax=Bacillus sp. 03113 TaxID=2578211 RepID=UPI0011444681|nr:AbrB/MazE/SpoVT family DNA-binding domain-containing protein [Bacillus sp. 03113]
MYVKRLLKNGQISIPKKVQNQLSLIEGDYLYIYKDQESIVIENKHHNQHLNQCIFRCGRVSIPIELRRLLDISYKTPLVMDASSIQNKIFIKALEQNKVIQA